MKILKYSFHEMYTHMKTFFQFKYVQLLLFYNLFWFKIRTPFINFVNLLLLSFVRFIREIFFYYIFCLCVNLILPTSRSQNLQLSIKHEHKPSFDHFRYSFHFECGLITKCTYFGLNYILFIFYIFILCQSKIACNVHIDIFYQNNR